MEVARRTLGLSPAQNVSSALRGGRACRRERKLGEQAPRLRLQPRQIDGPAVDAQPQLAEETELEPCESRPGRRRRERDVDVRANRATAPLRARRRQAQRAPAQERRRAYARAPSPPPSALRQTATPSAQVPARARRPPTRGARRHRATRSSSRRARAAQISAHRRGARPSPRPARRGRHPKRRSPPRSRPAPAPPPAGSRRPPRRQERPRDPREPGEPERCGALGGPLRGRHAVGVAGEERRRSRCHSGRRRSDIRLGRIVCDALEDRARVAAVSGEKCGNAFRETCVSARQA